MRFGLWISLVGVGASASLFGAAPAVAESCDPATVAPSCEGDTLSACVNDGSGNGTVQSVSCPSLFDALGPQLNDHTCGSYACVGDCDDVEVSCVGQPGAACAWQTAGSDPVVFCAPGNGCVLRREAEGFYEVCAPTAPCALGQAHAGCAGQLATACVPSSSGAWGLGDAVAVDCGTFGGNCVLDDTDAPRCEALEGGLCDDPALSVDTLLRCQPGLSCVGATAETYGTCTRPSAPPTDGGVEVDDGGAVLDAGDGGGSTSESRDAGLADGGGAAAGCSAHHVPLRGAPGWGLLALVVLVGGLRRR